MKRIVNMSSVFQFEPKYLGSRHDRFIAYRDNFFFPTSDNKANADYPGLRSERGRHTASHRPANANIGQTASSVIYSGVAFFKTFVCRLLPICVRRDAADKALTVEKPIYARLLRRQIHIVLDPCFMLRRRRKLEHLGAGLAFEHPMPDLRRLKSAVAWLKPERRALVFVNNLNAAAKAVDQLKIYLVVMNVIRNWTTLIQSNMRRDQLAAEPTRNQIAIHHPGASGDPPIRSSAFSRQMFYAVTTQN